MFGRLRLFNLPLSDRPDNSPGEKCCQDQVNEESAGNVRSADGVTVVGHGGTETTDAWVVNREFVVAAAAF